MSNITATTVKTLAVGFVAASNLAYANTQVEPIQELESPFVRRALCLNNGLQVRNQSEVLACREYFSKNSSHVKNDDNVAILDTVCYRRHRNDFAVTAFNNCRDTLSSYYKTDISGEGALPAIHRANTILAGTQSFGGNLLTVASKVSEEKKVVIIQQQQLPVKQETPGESCAKWAAGALVAKTLIHGAALVADFAGCLGACSAGATAITFGIIGTAVAGCAGGVGMNIVENSVASKGGSSFRPKTP